MTTTIPSTRAFKKTSLRDVAKEANVSLTTASIYLSGRTSICSAETGRRIKDATERLHYVPNSLERGLRFGKTNTIGVSAGAYEDKDFDGGETYSTSFWRGVRRMASKRGYAVLFYPPAESDSGDASPYLDGRVDGLIMPEVYSSGDARLAKIVAAGMPTVFTEIRDEDVPLECGAVMADEDETAAVALNHLRALGHRRIAHLSPSGYDYPTIIGDRRADGYSAWMKRHGEFDPDLIGAAGGWLGATAAPALEKLFANSDPPTAIFCANDDIAFAALRALAEMGIRVPEEISVVGVDHFYGADPTRSFLTSVEVPVALVGAEAVLALLRLIDGASVSDCRVRVPVDKLALGKSTGPARSRAR